MRKKVTEQSVAGKPAEQEASKKILQSQCVKFLGEVLNLRSKHTMEVEYCVDTRVQFAVEDNMISRLLVLTDNLELVDSIKSILLTTA